MMGRIGAATAAAMVMVMATLGGCASFDGTPHPVTATDTAVTLATTGAFDVGTAARIAAAGKPPGGGTLRDYRDAFLAVQMGAIDAQYFRFRRDLTAQAKGSNFVLDVAVLGLTGGGAVAGPRAANILSAGGAGLTGAKASLNKEVYFEKTLPALVASMDSRRLTLKVAILRKMRGAIDGYSLAEAIVDISTFQLSASIDAAIEQITGDANTAKEAATKSYTNLVATCLAPDPWAIAVAIGIKRQMAALDPATEKPTLDLIAAALDVPVTGDVAAERNDIVSALGSRPCTMAAANALSASLAVATDGKIR